VWFKRWKLAIRLNEVRGLSFIAYGGRWEDATPTSTTQWDVDKAYSKNCSFADCCIYWTLNESNGLSSSNDENGWLYCKHGYSIGSPKLIF
jgi:hypothetical protein